MPVGKRNYGPSADAPIKIQQMESWDEWSPSPSSRGRAVRAMQADPALEDTINRTGVLQNRPDDNEAAGTYANGGRVRKFGSSTHVTCKSKG